MTVAVSITRNDSDRFRSLKPVSPLQDKLGRGQAPGMVSRLVLLLIHSWKLGRPEAGPHHLLKKYIYIYLDAY